MQVMKTELREAMASGVFVEFRDARGNTLGQVVYTNWRGRPVPAVGDALHCTLKRTSNRRLRKVCGKVVSRQFDVQHDERGEPCVWVILIAQTAALSAARGFDRLAPPRPGAPRPRFSDN
jgi:hypothetical protein